jgi:hypothetical protein
MQPVTELKPGGVVSCVLDDVRPRSRRLKPMSYEVPAAWVVKAYTPDVIHYGIGPEAQPYAPYQTPSSHFRLEGNTVQVAVAEPASAAASVTEQDNSEELSPDDFAVAINTFKTQFHPGEPIPAIVAWGQATERDVYVSLGDPDMMIIRILDQAGHVVTPRDPVFDIVTTNPAVPGPFRVIVGGTRVEVERVHKLSSSQATVMGDVVGCLHPLTPGRYTLYARWGMRAYGGEALVEPPDGPTGLMARRGNPHWAIRSNSIEIEVVGGGE